MIKPEEIKVGLLVYLDPDEKDVAVWALSPMNFVMLGKVGEVYEHSHDEIWKVWFPACDRDLFLIPHNMIKANK